MAVHQLQHGVFAGVSQITRPFQTIIPPIATERETFQQFDQFITPDKLLWRAYATNSIGTAYGNELNFTTASFLCGDPVNYGGKTYHTIRIGTQCWFKENLNIGTMIDQSVSQTNNGIIEKYCYNNNPDSCSIYGGLYQWDELMQYSTTEGAPGIPPSDWHIPTDAEWIKI